MFDGDKMSFRRSVDNGESKPLLNPHADSKSDGSVWGSTFNLCNSAIGAGILSLPYAIKESGVILGFFLMLIMGTTLAYTLKILVWSNRLYPSSPSYEKLVLNVFGKKTSLLVTFSVIVLTFGACTGFLVIIADLITPIISLFIPNPSWVSSRLFVSVVLSILGILPLASLKNFNSLRFSSTFAIISVAFTVFIILFRSFQNLHNVSRSDVVLFNWNLEVFDALPLIGFAFGCHMQIVPIINELKDNHIPSRPNWVILLTSLACMVLYSTTGIFGYLRFFENTNGNILKNFPMDDALVNVGRVMLTLVIICHYPPSNYCCRAAIDYLLFPNGEQTTLKRLLLTFSIWGMSLLVAILVPSISVIFGLLGATGSSLTVLIIPGIFLLKLHNRIDWEGTTGTQALVFGSLLVVIGIIISVVGTTAIVVQNWVHH